ncbi:hypothetical protein JGH11_11630 [Dysgonomonas sp. Marseille-P4677]|uniref:hypothetical protein n=1 Tax=Dysgonomonas sp. Marseille-P4677 TaxID=2364790 RepID=UPI001911A6A4|nr:hypothetical protein [Dysgonomonas sp. Marseille-P4677]MBK5721523.1 hypothetical protein [Dysgonomonas sp. Marseille-P4677]
MNIQHLYQIIRKEIEPANTDIISLKNMIREYPYFQAGIFAYLKALYLFDNNKFEEELKQQSIAVNDRKALFYYIFSNEYDHFFRNTGKEVISDDRTSLLLDAFFNSKEDKNTDAELEYSISHSSLATTDYFTYILAVSPEEVNETILPPKSELNLKHQNIIDTFITRSESEDGIRIQIDNTEKLETKQTIEEKDESEDELNEDVFFTETLAKIYIKQKKYEKAFKIIKHLSLNYPKKNIYFADQLSFLEKLIINSKFKDIK